MIARSNGSNLRTAIRSASVSGMASGTPPLAPAGSLQGELVPDRRRLLTHFRRPTRRREQAAVDADRAAGRLQRGAVCPSDFLRHPEHPEAVVREELGPGQDVGAPDIGGLEDG